MRLTVHGERYAVVHLDPDAEVPAWAAAGPVSSVTRTASELSIVCREDVVPYLLVRERDLARACDTLRGAGHTVDPP